MRYLFLILILVLIGCASAEVPMVLPENINDQNVPWPDGSKNELDEAVASVPPSEAEVKAPKKSAKNKKKRRHVKRHHLKKPYRPQLRSEQLD